MIQGLKEHEFDFVFQIMEDSFPEDEYRPYQEQRALLDNPAYRIYLLKDSPKDLVKAFIAAWEFDDIIFIEHFAVSAEFRKEGLGSCMLQEFLADFRQASLSSQRKEIDKNICLEVEPPETEVAVRRIHFYERNGFFYHDYPYEQPPISQGKKAIPLKIMTYGRAVEETQFQRIKELLYAKVYGR